MAKSRIDAAMKLVHVHRKLGGRLLQDKYPTHYMPHVGRQVAGSYATRGFVDEARDEGLTGPTYDPMGNVSMPSMAAPTGEEEPSRGSRILEGFAKGFGHQPLGFSEENKLKYPITTGTWQPFVAPLDAAMRLPGGIAGAAAGAVGAGTEAFTGDTGFANRAERQARDFADFLMIEAGQVRPRAPTHTDSIPRGGEILPRETVQRPAIERAKPPTIEGGMVSEAPKALPEPPRAMLEAPKEPLEPVRAMEATPEPVPVITEAPATPMEPVVNAPKDINELRQAQETAKQAFDEAVQAVRLDRNNPELKAQVAQRKQEMMAATKEVEKAESSREPKPKIGSNTPPKPAEPLYAPPVSNMGLYSYAAEVAGRAKQAGRPEDLIAWIKSQPGVKFEELRDAGAINKDGSYNPSFAPGIEKMSPQELAERLHGSIPEITDVVKPEFNVIKFSDPVNLIDVAQRDPAVWNQVFSDVYGTWRINTPETAKHFSTDPEALAIAERAFNENNGEIKTIGGARYSPTRYPELTTFGGENYREIPLSLTPYEENPKKYYQIRGPFGGNTLYETGEQASQALNDIKARGAAIYKDDPSQLDVINRNLARSGVIEVDDPNFVSRNIMSYGHMEDVPNNVGWLRVQDVTSPNGRALRVEESQSDISQKGRERGFRMKPDELEALKAEIATKKKQYDEQSARLNEGYEQYIKENPDVKPFVTEGAFDRFLKDTGREEEFVKMADFDDEIRKLKKSIEKNDDKLPRLPYMEDTKQWTDLTTKRALIEAVKGGYDSLQFITGDINRTRYPAYSEGDAGYHYDVNVPSSLKRVLKSIDPDAKIEKIVQKPDIKDPRLLRMKDNIEYQIKNHENEIRLTEKEIKDDPNYEGHLDLELEDMRDRLNEYESQLDNLTRRQEFWSVKMTPKIREAVSKGLPRYKDGGKVSAKGDGSIVSKALMLKSPSGSSLHEAMRIAKQHRGTPRRS